MACMGMYRRVYGRKVTKCRKLHKINGKSKTKQLHRRPRYAHCYGKVTATKHNSKLRSLKSKEDKQRSDINCGQLQLQDSCSSIIDSEPILPGPEKYYTADNFKLLCLIGRGTFAMIFMVELQTTKQILAMKVINKSILTTGADMDIISSEKYVFETVTNHPFLVGLHSCFQTPSRLFFVMEFVRGGDMLNYMQNQRFLPEEHVQFYAAEIIVALEYLHRNGIIYRDLKLENVLLDSEGHIKLTDYGMCKVNIWAKEKTSTFCGTPNYIAPEILRGAGYSFSVDWWALGIIIFEMIVGRSPFANSYATNQNILFEEILNETIQMPASLSPQAAAVLAELLEKNPLNRLGAKLGWDDILDHAFFDSIDFHMLIRRQIKPPFRPFLNSETDVSYFPAEFTNDVVSIFPEEHATDDNTNQNDFEGFEDLQQLMTDMVMSD